MSVRQVPKLRVPTINRERLRNAGLQLLLSLLLSLALWTFVSFSVNPTVRRAVQTPIVVSEPAQGLILVDLATGEPIDLELSASLQLIGPQATLNQIAPNDFVATVDISTLGPGLHSVPITVNGPRGVRINRIDPATVNVRLAREATRTLEVATRTINRPPFLYQAERISVAATQVVVSGPEDLVARVERVLAPIDLSGRTDSVTEDVMLVAVDQDDNPVRGVTLTPPAVSVSIVIRPRVDQQRVAVAPRIINQPALGYVAEDIDWTPRYVDVISRLPLTGPIETEPIDLTGRTESFTTTVKLISPDPTTQLLTDTVTVSIPIVPFQIPTDVPWFVAVTPINTAAGLQATVQPPGLTITISGTANQLQQLVTNSPQATVDVAGLGPGTYTLPVTVELPPGLRLIGAPPQVTVTLAADTTQAPEGG